MSKDGFETISISDEVNKKITEYQKSRFFDLRAKEYSNGHTKLEKEGVRLNPIGVSAWNEANICKDDKGYKMTFTRDSMHEPLSIFRFKRGSLLGLEHIAKT